MKTLLRSILFGFLALALPARASTIVFSCTNFDTSICTNDFIVWPAKGPLWNGQYLQAGFPVMVANYAGFATNTLPGGTYGVTLENQIVPPGQFGTKYFVVPDDSLSYPLSELLVSGNDGRTNARAWLILAHALTNAPPNSTPALLPGVRVVPSILVASNGITRGGSGRTNTVFRQLLAGNSNKLTGIMAAGANGTSFTDITVSTTNASPAAAFTNSLGSGVTTEQGTNALAIYTQGMNVANFDTNGILTLAFGYVDFPTANKTLVGNGAGFSERFQTLSNREDTLVGFQAGYHLPGTYNSFCTAIGAAALGNMTDGSGDTAIGQKSFVNATYAVASTAIGSKAGASLGTPLNDTFIGYGAGENATITTPGVGSRTFIGYDAGLNYNGELCTFIGAFAGANGSGTGNGNAAIGCNAMQNVNYGSQNTAIGFLAGGGIVNAGDNTLIGYEAGSSAGDQINQTIVGAAAGQNNTGNGVVLLGFLAGNVNNESHVAILGGDDNNGYISTLYIGRDSYTPNAAGAPATIEASSGKGANITGAALTLAGGRGTGTGVGGPVGLAVARPGGSGTNVNSYTTALYVDGDSAATVITNSQLVLNQTTNTPANTNHAVAWMVLTNNGTQYYTPLFK